MTPTSLSPRTSSRAIRPHRRRRSSRHKPRDTTRSPGAQRCIQCHMGSESSSFVLGFMPLQINRRPVGVGGVIDPAGPDELTQLQRLIDYGVVTGIDSADDILPLEQSEGTRTPRNNYELVAQGYMLGNCAHCHNPRGYPIRAEPRPQGRPRLRPRSRSDRRHLSVPARTLQPAHRSRIDRLDADPVHHPVARRSPEIRSDLRRSGRGCIHAGKWRRRSQPLLGRVCPLAEPHLSKRRQRVRIHRRPRALPAHADEHAGLRPALEADPERLDGEHPCR